MLDYEDFSVDSKKFPLDRMKKLLENHRYIPIIDPGIKASSNSTPYI
jgi:hypothetical protein